MTPCKPPGISLELPDLKSQCQVHIQRKQCQVHIQRKQVLGLVDDARKLLLDNHSRIDAVRKQSGVPDQSDADGGDEAEAMKGFSSALAEWDSHMEVPWRRMLPT
eukprot:gene7365-489_t